MPYSYLGNMGLVQGINSGDPFFNRLGTTVNEKTFCASGSSTAWLLTRRPDRRRRSRELRAFALHRDLGLQLDLDQSASLAVRARSAEARRQGGGDRFLPVAHGQGRRLAYLPAARHRRCAGDGLHQFDHRPGSRRSGLCRAAHLWFRGAEGARRRVHAGLCRENHGRQSGRRHEVRARVRHHPALGHPHRRRARASCGRRAGDPRGVRAAGARRLMAPCRRRVCCRCRSGTSRSIG